MGRIKNIGHGTGRFNEGLIIDGFAGDDTHALAVTGSISVKGSNSQPALNVHGNLSNNYVAIIDNDQNSNGHVLKLETDGNGSGSRLLEMVDGDGDILFRARADGRFGFGPDGVDSMGAGTFVVGIDNSSHTSDIAISRRLQHLGDGDTYIDFPANDQMKLYVGNVNMIHMTEDNTQDKIVFNDGGADVDFIVKSPTAAKAIYLHSGNEVLHINHDEDAFKTKIHNQHGEAITVHQNGVVVNDDGHATIDFRIESDLATHMLFVDSGNNKIGIGTDSPQKMFHIKGDPGQFRVEDTTVDYAYTVDCDGDGIRTHFGDMTGGESGEDAFMTFGAYDSINRLDTAARDFHLYGTNTTTGFYFDESAGSFGVGTITPSAKLEVNGTTLLSGSVTVNIGGDGEALKLVGTVDHETRLVFEQPAGTDRASIELDAGDNLDIKNYSTFDDINFMTTDGTGTPVTGMVLTSGQRLGVGAFGWEGKAEYGTGENFPGCELDVSGSMKVSASATFKGAVSYHVRDVNSTSTVEADDYVLRCIQNASITLTLPAKATNVGRVLIFKDTLGNAGSPNNKTITLDGDSSDTIDGSATYVINNNKESVTLVCDGINGWMITSKFAGGG